MAAAVTSLEFCHISDDQIDSYIDIVARSRAEHPFERRLTAEEAKMSTMLDPDFDPKGSWVAYRDGKPVGVGMVIVERNRIDAGMDDGYVDIDVVPEHRNGAVEQELLDRSLEYIRSRGLGNARARSPATDRWKRYLFESRSFHEEYRVYVLARRGRSQVPPTAFPEGYTPVRKAISECSDECIASIVEAFNDSFRDHISFISERPERWTNFRDRWSDPIMFTLAMKGRTIAGICMSEESRAFNQERGVRSGWIDIIGVRPEHRRHGLARAMLADGIGWLQERGMDLIYLGVLAKNDRALGLYTSFGFEKDKESVWFLKPLGRHLA